MTSTFRSLNEKNMLDRAAARYAQELGKDPDAVVIVKAREIHQLFADAPGWTMGPHVEDMTDDDSDLYETLGDLNISVQTATDLQRIHNVEDGTMAYIVDVQRWSVWEANQRHWRAISADTVPKDVQTAAGAAPRITGTFQPMTPGLSVVAPARMAALGAVGGAAFVVFIVLVFWAGTLV